MRSGGAPERHRFAFLNLEYSGHSARVIIPLNAIVAIIPDAPSRSDKISVAWIETSSFSIRKHVRAMYLHVGKRYCRPDSNFYAIIDRQLSINANVIWIISEVLARMAFDLYPVGEGRRWFGAAHAAVRVNFRYICRKLILM